MLSIQCGYWWYEWTLFGDRCQVSRMQCNPYKAVPTYWWLADSTFGCDLRQVSSGNLDVQHLYLGEVKTSGRRKRFLKRCMVQGKFRAATLLEKIVDIFLLSSDYDRGEMRNAATILETRLKWMLSLDTEDCVIELISTFPSYLSFCVGRVILSFVIAFCHLWYSFQPSHFIVLKIVLSCDLSVSWLMLFLRCNCVLYLLFTLFFARSYCPSWRPYN